MYIYKVFYQRVSLFFPLNLARIENMVASFPSSQGPPCHGFPVRGGVRPPCAGTRAPWPCCRKCCYQSVFFFRDWVDHVMMPFDRKPYTYIYMYIYKVFYQRVSLFVPLNLARIKQMVATFPSRQGPPCHGFPVRGGVRPPRPGTRARWPSCKEMLLPIRFLFFRDWVEK